MATTASPDPSALLKLIPINAPFVEIWLNGIYTSLYFLTVWTLLFKAKPSKRNSVWLVIVTTMFTLSTLHMGLTWGFIALSFINHGATPQLPFVLARNPAWFKGLGGSIFVINILIADFLFIWRCWVVWERDWRVAVLPILSTLSGTVLGFISVAGQVIVTNQRVPGQIPAHFVTFSTPYFSLSLATSLMTAGLIAFRVMLAQKEMNRSSEKRINTSYAKLMEIVVESAVMYSIVLLSFVVLIALKSEKSTYAQEILSQVTGIAPTLIITRVQLGLSRPEEEWTLRKTDTHVDFASMSKKTELFSSTTSSNESTS